MPPTLPVDLPPPAPEVFDLTEVLRDCLGDWTGHGALLDLVLDRVEGRE